MNAPVHPAARIFRKRARSIYAGMKRRAIKHGHELWFTFPAFEEWLLKHFGSPTGYWHCAYSGQLIIPEDFCVDHGIPISRGGSFDLSNLVLCSEKENLRKGNMSRGEYEAFRKFVYSMPPQVAESIFKRLEVGDVQRFAYFKKQRNGR